MVTALNFALLTTPDVEIAVVPASTASGQLSPSESVSNQFLMPSLSISVPTSYSIYCTLIRCAKDAVLCISR